MTTRFFANTPLSRPAHDGARRRADWMASALRCRGFTMIEIAVSLAIIGFALVAIIGVLPTGMNVQKDNREETIVNQDASVLMDAIRSGAQGLDDLTNYVVAITNTVTRFADPPSGLGNRQSYWYTYTNSIEPNFNLTNGLRIVGLLSTPRWVKVQVNPRLAEYHSNHVVAVVRSLSGPASEKSPQRNPEVRDLGLSYRLLTDVISGPDYCDTNWLDYRAANLPAIDVVTRSNYALLFTNLQQNLHELRLTFRWPLAPNGTIGNGRQVFRATVGGNLRATNEPGFKPAAANTLYFFEPRIYVKAP